MKVIAPQAPLAAKLLLNLALRPLVGYAAYALIIVVLAGSSERPETAAIMGLLGPWVVVLLALINAPMIRATARRFRMSLAVKRNHALEHGTIFFLRRRYGRQGGIGGRAYETGFRLSGVRDPEDVRPAFHQMLSALREGEASSVVAARCGSMLVTAQAFGFGLLSVVLLGVFLFRPTRATASLVVVSGLVLVLLLRYPLGRWLQRRFFLSTEFTAAEIPSISEVSEPSWLERPRVFFVRTRVS